MHFDMENIKMIIGMLESDSYKDEFLSKRKVEEQRISNLPYKTRYDFQSLEKYIPVGCPVSKTSGSTGIPVIIPKTDESEIWHCITNYRELLWRNWDINKVIVIILAKIKKDEIKGSIHSWKITALRDIQQKLEELKPSYLYTYPSIVSYLDLSRIPSIIDIKTVGEIGGTNYSCEEAGTIALQCPNYPENYHIMENILVENHLTYGAVITDLSNPYVTRYIIGDKIETSNETCPCGRLLPVIKKIYGRVRNMLVLPNGDKVWPTVGEPLFRTKVSNKIRRHQIIQKNLYDLEIRVELDDDLTKSEIKSLENLVLENLGYEHLKCNVIKVDEFPPGKFEAFKSEL